MWVVEEEGNYLKFKKNGSVEFIVNENDVSDIYNCLRKFYGDIW